MQDNSQTGGLAQGSNAQDPNPTTGNNQATGNDQAPQAGQEQVDPQAFSKLKADHQAALGRLRTEQAEKARYAQENGSYKERAAELDARLKQLEARLSNPAKEDEPDFDTMSREETIKYLTEKAAAEGEKRSWSRFEKYMQEREQGEVAKQREAEVAKEEERYQKSWDEVFAADPEVDVEEVEKFMKEERIFNPKWAYTVMNQDLLKQQVATKAAKDTVNKIASNKKTFTEGPGKVGMTPPAKPDLSSKKSRVGLIKNRMQELLNEGNE